MALDISLIDDFTFSDVDPSDAPKFCDAWVDWAVWEDGTELTEEELEDLNENYPEFKYDNIFGCVAGMYGY